MTRLEAAVAVADPAHERVHAAARRRRSPRRRRSSVGERRPARRRPPGGRPGARAGPARRTGPRGRARRRRGRGAPPHSSASTRSSACERSASSAGSGSDSTSRTSTPGCALAQRGHRRAAAGAGSRSGTSRRAPRPRRRRRPAAARSASARSAAASSCSAWAASTSAASVSRTRRPAGSNSVVPASRWSTRELLGHGRRAVGQRLGDRADRAAPVQLVQEAQAAEVEHRSESSHDDRAKISVALDAFGRGMIGAMRGPSSASVSAAGVRHARHLRQAGLRRGGEHREHAARALRARRRSCSALVLRRTGGWAGAARGCRGGSCSPGSGSARSATASSPALYFAAIERLDVSLVALLLYTYPAFVTVAALALGRATPSLRTAVALVVASAGLVLVLLAAGTGAFDVARRAAGAGRVADVHDVHPHLGPDHRRGRPVRARRARADRRHRELRGRRPGDRLARPLAARRGVAVARADRAREHGGRGRRRSSPGCAGSGPSEAAILSTFEPVVTVVLAFFVLGERLAPAQLAGGALVLAAVVLLQLPARRAQRSRSGAPALAEPR